MSLRLRLASIFALVAIVTATIIAIVTPVIVDRGFRQAQADDGRSGAQGQGPGPRAGRGPDQAQQETTAAIVILGIAAAAGASVLGFVVAGRLVRPLEALRDAAADVAAGNLERRSDLAHRRDEIGDLGRSFDHMSEALERSDAARGRLFQDVAHELKTPLTVIEATTTAILDGVYQHDDRHLVTIREQSHVLAKLVDDLRTVSLAESGRMHLEMAEVDAAEMLRAVARTFASAAELAGVDLSVTDEGVPMPVLVDRQRLRQMLAALVDNSIRHASRSGSVVMHCRRHADRGVLSVQDDGPGIPADALAHVFERFYRADPSRQRSSGTSGLGLAIVKALADAQGGAAGAENVTPRGARFWIELPLAKPPG